MGQHETEWDYLEQTWDYLKRLVFTVVVTHYFERMNQDGI